jgi:hypothetical protein
VEKRGFSHLEKSRYSYPWRRAGIHTWRRQVSTPREEQVIIFGEEKMFIP